jgi:hypothetical protein
VKEGIDLLAREYGKLKEPWVPWRVEEMNFNEEA